jgi:hypothetical protein
LKATKANVCARRVPVRECLAWKSGRRKVERRSWGMKARDSSLRDDEEGVEDLDDER